MLILRKTVKARHPEQSSAMRWMWGAAALQCTASGCSTLFR
jgi:hypothetical protein